MQKGVLEQLFQVHRKHNQSVTGNRDAAFILKPSAHMYEREQRAFLRLKLVAIEAKLMVKPTSRRESQKKNVTKKQEAVKVTEEMVIEKVGYPKISSYTVVIMLFVQDRYHLSPSFQVPALFPFTFPHLWPK